MDTRQLLGKIFLRKWNRAPLITAASLLGVAAGTAMFLAMSSANLRVLQSLAEASAPARAIFSPAGPADPVRTWRSPTGRIDTNRLDACLTLAPRGIECRGVLTFPSTRVWKNSPGQTMTDPHPVRVIAVDGGLANLVAPAVTRDLLANVNALSFRPAAVIEGTDESFVIIDHADADKFMAVSTTTGTGHDNRPGFDFIEASAPGMTGSAAEDLFAKIEGMFEQMHELSGGSSGRLVASAQDDEFEDRRNMTASYRLNLSVLGLMSVLVAGLLLRNTAALQMLLRRPAVSILRQLGASRGQVLRMVLAEQALLAVTGAAAGVVLGTLLEQAISEQVLATVRNLYTQTVSADSAHRDLAIPAMLSATAGITIYLVASLAMLRDLLAIQPRDLSSREFESRQSPSGNHRALRAMTAAIAVVILAAAPWIPPLDLRTVGLASVSGRMVPVFGYIAALAIFILAFATSGALAWLMAFGLKTLTRGTMGSVMPAIAISSRRALRARRKPEAAVATLATGLALVTGITIMVDGFRTSLTRWLDASFTAEVVALPRQNVGQETRPRLPGPRHELLKATLGVHTDCVLLDDGRVNGMPVKIAGIDDALPEGYADPLEIMDRLTESGLDSRAVIANVVSSRDQFLASEALARRLGVRPGDTVSVLPSAAGRRQPVNGTVVAVVRDYSSELGFLFMGKKSMESLTGLDGCHSLRVYTRGESPIAFEARVKDSLPDVHAVLNMTSSKSLKDNALSVFEQTFKVTGILTVLAAILGGLALVVQIAQAAASRRLEWLALRRLGISWQGMVRLVAADVFLSIAAGVALGQATGWILGWLLVEVINRQAFGWSILMGGPQSLIEITTFSVLYGAVLWVCGVVTGWWTMRPGGKWNVRRE